MPAAGKELTAELRQAVPCYTPKPFNPVDAVAVAVFERFINGDGEVCYGLASGRELQVGVAADVP